MSFRSADPKFPYVSHQMLGDKPFKFLMVSERSESWYTDAVKNNAAYLSLIEPGDRVLDVGGNEGYTTILAALKSGGEMLVFEPAAHNWQPLDANLAMNGLVDRVHVHRVAIGELGGNVDFKDESVGGLEGTVGMNRLDDFIEFAPNVIKIDVEGYEGHVIRGAAKMLATHRPALFLEVHLGDVTMRNYGDTPEELFAFLALLGYECFRDGKKVSEFTEGSFTLLHPHQQVKRQPFPKAVVITLPANVTRQHRSKLEFDKAGIRVEPFMGFDNRRSCFRATINGRQSGLMKGFQIGCAISHVMLWRMLRDHVEGDEFVIFEDDVLLSESFRDEFSKSYKALPADWQFVFVGADQIEGRDRTRINDRIEIVKYPYGTHAYMIRRNALDVMLHTNDIITSNIDVQLALETLPHLRHYTFVPSLARQASSEWHMRKP